MDTEQQGINTKQTQWDHQTPQKIKRKRENTKKY
jgi:hypothetical protein